MKKCFEFISGRRLCYSHPVRNEADESHHDAARHCRWSSYRFVKLKINPDLHFLRQVKFTLKDVVLFSKVI